MIFISGSSILYNFYRSGADDPTATLIQGTQLSLSLYCSRGLGPGDTFSLPIQAGHYLVKAVDWAGNEDGNQVTFEIVDSCSNAPAVDGGGADVVADRPRSDLSSSVTDGSPLKEDAPPAVTPTVPSPGGRGGCGCGVAGPNLHGMIPALIAIVLPIARRRR